MNDDVLTYEDERSLDRLVDGELNETERRDLLLRLEHSTDGWRRCALAFLEAQAWRGEAKALVAEPAETPTIRPASIAGRGWAPRVVGLPIAVAAGFLVAFVAGQLLMPPPVAVPPPNIVAATPEPTIPPATAVADAASSPQNAPQQIAPPRAARNENLRLVVAGAGGDRPQNVVEVPLVDPQRLNEVLFGTWSQALPPELVHQLQQAGHQVVRQRQLVPVDLQDGRRVVVPLDEVEIRPVSNTAYQ